MVPYSLKYAIKILLLDEHEQELELEELEELQEQLAVVMLYRAMYNFVTLLIVSDSTSNNSVISAYVIYSFGSVLGTSG